MSKSAGIAIYNITRFFEDICERAKRKWLLNTLIL
jgi:hypothetical protein